MGVLGTLMIIIFLISRTSWISDTTNLLYARCCRRKGTTPSPSIENESQDAETHCKQLSPGDEQYNVEARHPELHANRPTETLVPNTGATKTYHLNNAGSGRTDGDPTGRNGRTFI